MSKRIKKVVVIMSAFMLLAANAIFCYAGVQKTIYIYPNKVWTAGYENSDTRTGKYSYVLARNLAVYPENGGEDTFTTIHVRVEDPYGVIISEQGDISLRESSINTTIQIQEGYLDVMTVCFSFRGNSNSSATAEIYYDAK